MARPQTKSPPIKAAWRKGFSAGRRGLQEAHNPHLEDGQAVGDVRGWSRLYAQTWHDGWVDGTTERVAWMTREDGGSE